MSNFQIGDYAVESMLGEGAVAVVYKATRVAGRADDVIISAGWTRSAVKIEDAILKHEQVNPGKSFSKAISDLNITKMKECLNDTVISCISCIECVVLT